MQRLVKDYLNELKKQQRRRRKAAIAALLLVVLVTGTIAGHLTRSGVAMTEDVKCGLEEHVHTDECYQDILICGQEDAVYTEAEPEAAASQAEPEGHHHTEDCYVSEQMLDCGQEESEGHQHTEACYEPETILDCDEEEGEEHEHTEDCYRSEENLICRQEEREGHQHTEDCYRIETTLQCGQEESGTLLLTESAETEEVNVSEQEGNTEHVHTEECYERQLVCGLDERRMDASADVEDPSDWDAQYAEAEWKGSWGEDLVTAAQVQIGYRESLDNYQIAADGSRKGYTRYGAFAGDAYADWDAAFVNFCMYYAGLAEKEIFPEEIDAAKWHDTFAEKEENVKFLTNEEGYEPKAGDLIFFERGTDEEKDLEMGIVSSYDAEQDEITVIEGDSDNEVRENTYERGDAQICEYLMVTEVETSVKNHTLTVEGEDYTITVHFTEEAGIPEGTILNVREIEADSDEYQMYYEQSLEAVGAEEFSFARYFDITFLADGEKIEPSAPVDVEITYADPIEMDEEGSNHAVHFAKDGVEVLDVETDEEGRFFNFSQDSFSVTGTARAKAAARGAAGVPRYYNWEITNVRELDGNSYLITNIGTNAHNIMQGQRAATNATIAKYYCLKGPVFNSSGPDGNMPYDDTYFWTFIKVPDDLDPTHYYIRNKGTGKYLSVPARKADMLWEGIDTKNGATTGRMKIELTDNAPTAFRVDLNAEDGTVAISKTTKDDSGKEYRFFINNGSGGTSEHFTLWHDSTYNTTTQNNKLRLYRAERYIVLNPCNIDRDNRNSTYRFKIDNSDKSKKIAIDVTDLVAAGTTSMSITLPDDVGRNNFYINGENHSIVDSTAANAYKWELQGWYNAATGIYYSVKGGSCEVPANELDLRENNVFYADWAAADYNNAAVKTGETVHPTAGKEETQNFLTTELFDYNELVNIALADITGIGAELKLNNPLNERWSAVNGFTGGKGFNFMDGAYNYSTNTNGDSIIERDKNNKIVTVSGSLGYPTESQRVKMPDGFAVKDSILFQTLFSDSGAWGVHYVGRADGLYEFDGSTGYYKYDSDEHGASYNKTDERFYVYESNQQINRTKNNSSTASSFLPLNGEESTYTHMDGQINYWFGMKTEIDFWLNDNSDKANGESSKLNYNGNDPMVFRFTGDDDLWVFDEQGTLLLNLSGVHGKLSGSINFSTGTVSYQDRIDDTKSDTGSDNTKNKTTDFSFTSGAHKLTIYYMERGGGLSNCKISFNLVPPWEFEGDPVQAVTARKVWMKADGETEYSDDEKEGLSAEVELYEVSADEAGTRTETKIGEPQTLDEENGWTYTWKYLNKDKQYVVKEVKQTSFETTISDPSPVTDENRHRYWRESSSLVRDGRIVIGNGQRDSGKILAVNPLTREIVAFDVKASEEGNVLEDKMLSDEHQWIEMLSDEHQWIVRMDQESSGGHQQFKLESAKLTGWYLNINDTDDPRLVEDAENASDSDKPSVFYFSGNGNLTGTNNNRLVLTDDKSEFKVVSKTDAGDTVVNGASTRRVHIYKYDDTETESKQTSYTITNTLIATQIQIRKISQSSQTPLPKAKFELYSSEDGTWNNAKPIGDKVLSASGSDGVIEIGSLSAGTYYLVETKAPEGYALLSKPIKIIVSKESESSNPGMKVEVDFQISGWGMEHVKFDSTSNTFCIEVPNTMLYTLPSTGGEGIYWYTISGTLLMIAGMLILYKRKCVGRC